MGVEPLAQSACRSEAQAAKSFAHAVLAHFVVIAGGRDQRGEASHIGGNAGKLSALLNITRLAFALQGGDIAAKLWDSPPCLGKWTSGLRFTKPTTQERLST
ncbi:hypothetical protein ASC94_11185 [Massilia sp. Root418]|nr:hypothetical protein ASC94_11185 [Massilia sp. Root418]